MMHDPYFRVTTLEATPEPQRVCYRAMRQDYSEGDVSSHGEFPSGQELHYGELLIKHLLAGGRGHFGVLEHPQITFNCVGFPHDVPMQARTHRVGISFDIQSQRYTGERTIAVAIGDTAWEEVFYLRPVGEYPSREGKPVPYTEAMRSADAEYIMQGCRLYAERCTQGIPAEAARHIAPQGIRQNFVVSFNARSLMHLLDLRAKADAQLEIRILSEMLMSEFELWMPEVASWYKANRWEKAKLSP